MPNRNAGPRSDRAEQAKVVREELHAELRALDDMLAREWDVRWDAGAWDCLNPDHLTDPVLVALMRTRDRLAAMIREERGASTGSALWLVALGACLWAEGDLSDDKLRKYVAEYQHAVATNEGG